MNNRRDCRKCIHFFVTWEDACPFGCRAFGIKSQYIPSRAVSRHSGQECMLYTPKNNKQNRGC